MVLQWFFLFYTPSFWKDQDGKFKVTALTRDRFYRYLATMSLDDLFTDRKPDTISIIYFSAVEALENLKNPI